MKDKPDEICKNLFDHTNKLTINQTFFLFSQFNAGDVDLCHWPVLWIMIVYINNIGLFTNTLIVSNKQAINV